LQEAVADVAATYGLATTWVNVGPGSLLDFGMPDGFVDRLERRDFSGLVAWLPARTDMIHLKLYAAIDQGPTSRHAQDLLDLRPSREDLLSAARWSRTHDPSHGYRSVLVASLTRLGIEDADDVIE
jgi:hypothetical protein